MMFRVLLVLLAVAFALPAMTNDADARPRQKRQAATYETSVGEYGQYGYVQRPRGERRQAPARRAQYRSEERMSLGYSSYSSGARYGAGPRPSRWCGWWMRTQRGGGPEFNVAWNWRNYGSPASPQVGAVVVWRHHVGQIVGQASDGRWLIQSGNDGNAVRTRPRSISGAVIRM